MVKLVDQIKYQLSRLESLYNLYGEYKEKSKTARLKKDRERATSSMFSYAEMIERTLVNPPIAEIIVDGGQYQFEDFYKYVDSDLPDYIKKIKERIAELENPTLEEESPVNNDEEEV